MSPGPAVNNTSSTLPRSESPAPSAGSTHSLPRNTTASPALNRANNNSNKKGNSFQWPPSREVVTPTNTYISPHSRTSSPAPVAASPGTRSPAQTPTPILKTALVNNTQQQHQQQPQQQQHVQFKTEDTPSQQQQQFQQQQQMKHQQQVQQQKIQQQSIPIPVKVNTTNTASLHNPPPGPPAGLNGQNGVNGLNGQNGLNNGLNGQGGQGGQGGQAVSAPRRGRGVLQQQTPGMRVPMCGSCDLQIRGPFITAMG